MKLGEKGYSIVELLIAITIMVLAAGAASTAIFQIIRNMERNNDHITVVRQIENAGYWISRDAQMARVITASDNLTLPGFLSLSWTEWDAIGDPTSHSANYSFEDLADGVGKLKRTYGSANTTEQTLIAQYVYYDPDDANSTSNTSYESPVLTVKLTAVLEGFQETREYKIRRRPDL
ncbi:type II secretion system protein J [Chloroflexota bacterium]